MEKVSRSVGPSVSPRFNFLLSADRAESSCKSKTVEVISDWRSQEQENPLTNAYPSVYPTSKIMRLDVYYHLD